MSFSKVAKPRSVKSGRFGVGKFGSAKFDKKDGYTKQAKQTSSFAKTAKP